MDAGKSSESSDDAVLKEEQLCLGKSSTVVDWRVLEAEEDSCSICLETFTDEDPSTVTSCSHHFHLQCIMEWAQRSTECPNCWQALALNDPDSQELLSACFEERNLRLQEMSPPTFDDFEFRRRILLANRDEADLERRILQHLAAAAAGLSIHSDNRRANPSNVVNTSTDDNSRERLGPRQIALPVESSSNNQSAQRAGSNQSSNNSPTNSYWGFFTGENTSTSPPSSSPPSSSPPSRSTSSGNPHEREVGGFGDLFKSRTWNSYRESFHRSTRSMREKFKVRNSSAVADLSARAREMGAGVVRAFESITMPSDAPRDNQSSSNNMLHPTSSSASPSPSSPRTTLSAPSLPSSSASFTPTTIDSPSSVTDSSPQSIPPSILSSRSPSPLSHESSNKTVNGITEDMSSSRP